jgi:hypothetical protein
MGIIAQLLKSRFRNGFVPIAVETDTLTAQPTLLGTSGRFTVDFGNLQPRSAWRTLALNVLNMLVLVFTNLASPFFRFSSLDFSRLKACNVSNYLMNRN